MENPEKCGAIVGCGRSITPPRKAKSMTSFATVFAKDDRGSWENPQNDDAATIPRSSSIINRQVLSSPDRRDLSRGSTGHSSSPMNDNNIQRESSSSVARIPLRLSKDSDISSSSRATSKRNSVEAATFAQLASETKKMLRTIKSDSTGSASSKVRRTNKVPKPEAAIVNIVVQKKSQSAVAEDAQDSRTTSKRWSLTRLARYFSSAI